MVEEAGGVVFVYCRSSMDFMHQGRLIYNPLSPIRSPHRAVTTKCSLKDVHLSTICVAEDVPRRFQGF